MWVLYGFHCKQRYIPLNDINQLMFVMVKFGVLFEVRSEFLTIISTSFGLKGLMRYLLTLSIVTFTEPYTEI
jgi:hypothetical protein